MEPLRKEVTTTLGEALKGLRQLTPEEAPGMHAFVADLSERLKVAKPDIFYSPSELPNALMMMPMDGARSLVFSQGMYDITGMKSLRSAPTAGMQGMIGHEMSHFADGAMHLKATYALPIGSAILAAGAAYAVMLRIFNGEGGKPVTKTTLRHAKEETQKEISAVLEQEPVNPHRSLQEEAVNQVLTLGAVLAAGALGLAGGLNASRRMTLAGEFRADRLGASLSGNAEEYINVLKTMTQKMEEFACSFTFKSHPIHTSPTFGKALEACTSRIKNAFRHEIEMLKLDSVHAHPSLAERVSAIREAFPSNPARA